MEILLVLIVALIVFGPKRLPELGRSVGKGLKEFKGSVSETGNAFQATVADKHDDAIALYRQIQGQGPHFAPFALMNIAALEERANKPQEAAESYKQLINGFPQFPFAAEAKHRLSLLVEDADAYLKQSAEPKP